MHVFGKREETGAYLVDVGHLWPNVVLFDRLLFGIPAWEWQHNFRGMRHPDKRRDSMVTQMYTLTDSFEGLMKLDARTLTLKSVSYQVLLD